MIETQRRADLFPDRQKKYRGVPTAECPPGLRRYIEETCNRLAGLAAAGLWTRAADVFVEMREQSLRFQPSTVDPFELPLTDTSLPAQVTNALLTLGVQYVGQLAHVPPADFKAASIGPARMKQIREVASLYGVRIRCT